MNGLWMPELERGNKNKFLLYTSLKTNWKGNKFNRWNTEMEQTQG